MNNWNVEFTKMLKQRDNKTLIGNTVGTVIQKLPSLQVSILEGNAILDNDDLYVAERLITNPYAESFNVGDSILLLPDADENKWFIIDRIRKL